MRGEANSAGQRPLGRWSQRARTTWPLHGRDPEQAHRASTPLELLFDLSAVVAFDQIARHVGDSIADGSLETAGIGLLGATFAVCWAWINYTWLASAYDSDDVLFRVATLLELNGVLIVAIGVGPLFESIKASEPPDTTLVVVGYVVMRVTAVALWLRAGTGDPTRRRVALTYAGLIPLVQAGWVILAATRPPSAAAFGVAAVLAVGELGVPAVAEARGPGTPWHPSHVAERYGLLTIIALGEVLTGAAEAAIAVLGVGGADLAAVGVLASGAVLTFGAWWLYFTIPSARGLRQFRRTAFSWGYVHIALFVSTIAMGAGFHLVALRVADGDFDAVPVVRLTAVAVGAFVLSAFLVRVALLRNVRAMQIGAHLGAGGALLLAILLDQEVVVVAAALVSVAPLIVVIASAAGDRADRSGLPG